MLGGSCSPCCSQCFPINIPDALEIDVSSTAESDVYASLRFRTGRFSTTGTCETDYAVAYVFFGVPSGTITLDKTQSLGGFHQYSFSSSGFSISAVIMESNSMKWGGNFADRFGRGVYLTVLPLRIVRYERKWPTYSGISSSVPDESEVRQASVQIGQQGSVVNTIGGVTETKQTVANYASTGAMLYADAIFPCAGGVGSFAPSIGSPLYVTTNATWDSPEMSWTTAAQFPLSSGVMTDDIQAIKNWDTFFVPECGRTFPLPYFLSAGGAFTLNYDTVSNDFTNNGTVIPFRLMRYGWNPARQISISGIRGKMFDGTEVRVL